MGLRNEHLPVVVMILFVDEKKDISQYKISAPTVGKRQEANIFMHVHFIFFICTLHFTVLLGSFSSFS